MKYIPATQLPKRALALISERQKSYIDEFSFLKCKGHIRAFYASELIAIWINDSDAWLEGTRMRRWFLEGVLPR